MDYIRNGFNQIYYKSDNVKKNEDVASMMSAILHKHICLLNFIYFFATSSENYPYLAHMFGSVKGPLTRTMSKKYIIKSLITF